MDQSLQLENRSKELLDLPVEIIQHFLLNATTPTFLQAIYSCRTLYDIALQCREVLTHHLERVPGFLSGVGPGEADPVKDNKELFLLLRRRACAHLYGANFCAEKTTFKFPSAECGGIGDIKVSACSLTCSEDVSTLLVRKGDSIHSDRVYRYGVGARDAILHEILWLPYDHPGKVEVLKTAYSDPLRTLSVLYRYTPKLPIPNNHDETAYRKQLMIPFRQQGVQLIHYNLDAPERIVCAFPDHLEYVPLAMAVANEAVFAISWEHVSDSNLHEVVMYVIEEEDMDNDFNVVSGIRYVCCSGAIVVNSEGSVPDAIMSEHIGYRPANAKPIMERSAVTHIDFGDQNNQLLYSYGASPMYKSYQNLACSEIEDLQATVLFPNSCTVRFTEHINLRFSIDLPFYGTHEGPAPGDNPSLCTWKYLSIGIATHRKEGWTVACLLKSQTSCRSLNCGHVMNLKRGRRFAAWRVVARLWGYRKPSDSIGGIIATSTSSRRIAIANWDVIYVWALNPHQIIEENSGGYYRNPSNFQRSPSSSVASTPFPAPNADEGTETAARNKSAALNEADEGMIELKPIVLPLGAVCFKLEFVAEKDDELVALTDKGLMCWSLGPSGKGRRDLRESLLTGKQYEYVYEHEHGREYGCECECECEHEDGGENEEEEEVKGQPARKRQHITT